MDAFVYFIPCFVAVWHDFEHSWQKKEKVTTFSILFSLSDTPYLVLSDILPFYMRLTQFKIASVSKLHGSFTGVKHCGNAGNAGAVACHTKRMNITALIWKRGLRALVRPCLKGATALLKRLALTHSRLKQSSTA